MTGWRILCRQHFIDYDSSWQCCDNDEATERKEWMMYSAQKLQVAAGISRPAVQSGAARLGPEVNTDG